MKKKSDAAKRKLPKKVVSHPAKVRIRKIPTGVRGLDDILGGGIPEFSFNIIAGAPGCGKTTLAHQIVFANATTQKPALYFTVLGEPALKMLRYQQQYTFFDEAKLGKAIRFINLSEALMNQDLNAVLEEIIKQVTAAQPGFVVVDSFRTMVRSTKSGGATELAMQSFIQHLAQFLTSWEATSFLVGEYDGRRCAIIRSSQSLMASSGSHKWWRAIPWCEKCKSSNCAGRPRCRACTPSASAMTGCKRSRAL